MFNFQRLSSLALFFIFTSCSVSKQISKSAGENVLTNKALLTAHIGISIFEPATNTYWFNHQGDKYFVPASNTKIPTCYAAMKYLGDSLKGVLYEDSGAELLLIPTGDPTLLHPDFKRHPVFDFLKKDKRQLIFTVQNWRDEGWGSGWSWNDYNEYYMAERSPLPVYGNVLRWIHERTDSSKPSIIYSLPEINWEINFNPEADTKVFDVKREIEANIFILTEGREKHRELFVPFKTFGLRSALELLTDTLGIKVISREDRKLSRPRHIYSQATDSMLKPMMHRSDNFFAEQSLMMVSNEKLGYMDDARIIETLLKTDFKDLPQRPRWADGSGLSRYNLFTPQDFVAILGKMKNEFGMDRIKTIFPTGGEGTISSYYKADSGYVYGKTGTLSGVVAFSGFMYTKKGKFLIFSTLVNNHQASATDVRRAVEKFLQGIRNRY